MMKFLLTLSKTYAPGEYTVAQVYTVAHVLNVID